MRRGARLDCEKMASLRRSLRSHRPSLVIRRCWRIVYMIVSSSVSGGGSDKVVVGDVGRKGNYCYTESWEEVAEHGGVGEYGRLPPGFPFSPWI